MQSCNKEDLKYTHCKFNVTNDKTVVITYLPFQEVTHAGSSVYMEGLRDIWFRWRRSATGESGRGREVDGILI